MSKRLHIRQNENLIFVQREKKSNRPLKVSGANDEIVNLLDPGISHWIKVVKPSRSSLKYERME
jgi:hypothetical protein